MTGMAAMGAEEAIAEPARVGKVCKACVVHEYAIYKNSPKKNVRA